jgi:hypothetical protein
MPHCKVDLPVCRPSVWVAVTYRVSSGGFVYRVLHDAPRKVRDE